MLYLSEQYHSHQIALKQGPETVPLSLSTQAFQLRTFHHKTRMNNVGSLDDTHCCRGHRKKRSKIPPRIIGNNSTAKYSVPLSLTTKMMEEDFRWGTPSQPPSDAETKKAMKPTLPRRQPRQTGTMSAPGAPAKLNRVLFWQIPLASYPVAVWNICLIMVLF